MAELFYWLECKPLVCVQNFTKFKDYIKSKLKCLMEIWIFCQKNINLKGYTKNHYHATTPFPVTNKLTDAALTKNIFANKETPDAKVELNEYAYTLFKSRWTVRLIFSALFLDLCCQRPITTCCSLNVNPNCRLLKSKTAGTVEFFLWFVWTENIF